MGQEGGVAAAPRELKGGRPALPPPRRARATVRDQDPRLARVPERLEGAPSPKTTAPRSVQTKVLGRRRKSAPGVYFPDVSLCTATQLSAPSSRDPLW